jgi:hypothetical protein
MNKIVVVICLIVISAACLFAQVGQDSIYLWDNDCGKVSQYYPTVGVTNTRGFICWQDARAGDYDIWRTYRNWIGTLIGPDRCVSPDDGGWRLQTRVDAEGNPSTGVVYTWEDSLYRGAPAPTRIMAAIYNGAPFVVFSNAMSHKNPSVSCANNGDFVISFTSWASAVSAIRAIRYNASGVQQATYSLWTSDSLRKWPPISRVAFCDSGFVVVYEDSTTANARSVYLAYRKRDGTNVVSRLKVTNPGYPAETYNEYAPAVAVNATGYVVVVWQDERNGAVNPDIFYRTFQMEPGVNNLVQNAEGIVSNASYRDEWPRVTVFPNGDFFVVWHQYQGTPVTSYDIRGRVFYGTNPKTTFTLNTIDTLNQIMPDVECRNSDTCYVAWMSNANDSLYDVYCRCYFKFSGLDYGMAPGFTPELLLTPDTIGGRKIWYFDNENYDNPATPAWNEDPIMEPDSVYVDIDFAMVDQLMELNTNNQYVVFNEDTLPRRRYQRNLSVFDAVLLDLGYRTDYATAGVISNTDQTTIEEYLNPGTGSGGPVMVEGNDFGSMYSATPLFPLFHAEYRGDGAPYALGNIDTLYGTSNTFSKGETLRYNYMDLADNYPDSFRVRDQARIVLYGSGAPTDWIAGRTVGYAPSWKKDSRVQGRTILNGFALSGITSTTHPHTYAEYFRRALGFLGLLCQPEPITTLTAVPGTTEGRVTITWNVANDDTLGESAEGPYKLKFMRAKMTSEAAFDDSSETYYQTWNTKDSAVGHLVTQGLSGLPPLDTLVFALKVSDEDTLWDALGAEPQAVVYGDSVTPHSLTLGLNYVKDFSNAYEFLHRRRPNDAGTNYDSLFVTWSASYFYLGFARCNFRTEGDLFVYVDTKTGGGDSTVDYNGSSGRSSFIATFRPDYALIIEDSGTVLYKRWNPAKDSRGMWEDTTFNGAVMIDNTVNQLLYTELRILFSGMGYTSPAPFKLVVLMQNESTNEIINAFPISNPLGSSQYIAAYYYWDGGLAAGYVPNKSYAIIGIEEEAQAPHEGDVPYMTAAPNPFAHAIDIRIPQSAIFGGQGRSLKIYDVTGRLVRTFGLTGTIQWNGRNEDGVQLPFGVYFCCLTTNEASEVLKVIYSR